MSAVAANFYKLFIYFLRIACIVASDCYKSICTRNWTVVVLHVTVVYNDTFYCLLQPKNSCLSVICLARHTLHFPRAEMEKIWIFCIINLSDEAVNEVLNLGVLRVCARDAGNGCSCRICARVCMDQAGLIYRVKWVCIEWMSADWHFKAWHKPNPLSLNYCILLQAPCG